MTREEALKTLELLTGATEAEVKKAYRRLAMRYHPDHNDSAGAKAKFIEVREAYEHLTSQRRYGARSAGQSQPEDKRYGTNRSSSRPDFRHPNHNFSRSRYAHESYKNMSYEERYERARKAAEEFYTQRSNEIYRKFFEEYKAGWKRKWVMVVAVVATVLSILFTADFFLADNAHYADVEWLHPTKNDFRYYVVFDGYKVGIDEAEYFVNSNIVSVVKYYTTPLFGDLTDIVMILPGGKAHGRLDSQVNAATTFPVVPLLLLYPLLGFFVERPGFGFVFFNVHANMYVIPAWIVFLLFHDGRLMRLFGI